jgi:hypothetical protein
MKQFLLALALLFFVLGCKKYEAEYTVNCQFPPFFFFFGERILLVTNTNGDVLEKIEVPPNANSLSEVFSAKGKDLSELYDLHLLVFPDSGRQSLQVYSHFDIPNGASVYFGPKYDGFQTLFYTPLRVEGIESFDSLKLISGVPFQAVIFDAATKSINTNVYRPANHGILIKLKANGESAFRQFYLPDGQIETDTNVVNWQDFKPESNLRSIEVPANFSLQNLEVTAISPDFKEFGTIEMLNIWENNNQLIPPQFFQPEGLPEPVAFRIRAANSEGEFEQIFQPGEPLRFESADMTIDNFTLSDRRLQVSVSGSDIDLIEVELNSIKSIGTYKYVTWIMDGDPETLRERTLPDLNNYLPDWYFSAATIKFQKLSALQFDKYDYPQVREGFPYKLSEPYSLARSGYKAVWKWY